MLLLLLLLMLLLVLLVLLVLLLSLKLDINESGDAIGSEARGRYLSPAVCRRRGFIRTGRPVGVEKKPEEDENVNEETQTMAQ